MLWPDQGQSRGCAKNAEAKNCGQSHPGFQPVPYRAILILRFQVRGALTSMPIYGYIDSYWRVGYGLISALCCRRVAGILRLRLPSRVCCRNMEAENRTIPLDRFEIHRAVVPLEDLIGLCQTDAAALFFRREIQLEDFVMHILRYTGTLIADLREHHIILLSG